MGLEGYLDMPLRESVWISSVWTRTSCRAEPGASRFTYGGEIGWVIPVLSSAFQPS